MIFEQLLVNLKHVFNMWINYYVNRCRSRLLFKRLPIYLTIDVKSISPDLFSQVTLTEELISSWCNYNLRH